MATRSLRIWGMSLLPMLVLAVCIIRLGLADALAERDADAAIGWWPDHVEARVQIAAKAAEQGAYPLAAGLARAVLADAPLTGLAHRVLARIAEREGDEAGAEPHFLRTVRHAPRDRPSRAWLANYYAARGNFQSALDQTDQLLRVAPVQLPQTMPLLASFAANPEARVALLRKLGEQAPPWRVAFLQWLLRQPDAMASITALMSPLRSAPHPLTLVERNAWLERLMQEKRFGEAQFLWIESLTAERREYLGNVFDGGFELPAENSGFGWYFRQVAGATIHQDAGIGIKGQRALVIDFHDRRVPFAHVTQRLALPAGHYLLEGRVRVDGVRNERGLLWSLRCDDGRVIADTERFMGSSPWHDFGVEFERPAEGCEGQSLLLRLDARIAPEQMIGGRIWFDQLRIKSHRP